MAGEEAGFKDRERIVKFLKCGACSHRFPLALQERPVPATNLLDVGVECPNCRAFTHSYYITPHLKEFQVKLWAWARQVDKGDSYRQRYEVKKAEYEAEFKALQERMKQVEGEQNR